MSSRVPGRFDHYVSRALGRDRIFTPRDVMGPHHSVPVRARNPKATYAGTNPRKQWARAGCRPFEVRDGPRSKQMEC